MSTTWRDRALLFLASLTVHGLAAAAVSYRNGSVDAHAFQSLDATEYYRNAVNLADHGVFSRSKTPPLRPDTWRTPGYPLFLATVTVFFGREAVVLIVVQLLVASASMVLVREMALEFLGRNRATLMALLVLLDPYRLYYCFWLLPPTWILTILIVIWSTWMTALRERHEGWYLLLGGLSAYLILVWPGAVLIPVPLLVCLVAQGWKSHRRLVLGERTGWAWRSLVGFAAASGLVLVPWMIRNRQVAGHAALSDQSGVVLAYFKAAEVMLWRQGRSVDRYLELSTDSRFADSPHTVWDLIDRELVRRLPDVSADARETVHWRRLVQGNASEVDSFRVSAVLRQIAWHRLSEHPVSTAACYLVRMVDNLTFPLSLAIDPPAGIEPQRGRWVILATPYVLVAIGLTVRLTGRRGWSVAVATSLALCLTLMISTAPQIEPRFRVPWVPLLLMALLSRRNDQPGQIDNRGTAA